MSAPVASRVTHRRRASRKRVLAGVALAVAIFGAVEAGLLVLAEGYPDPIVRLGALALAVAVGKLVVRLGSPPLALLLYVFGPAVAEAADRERSPYNVTIASSACPTGTPGRLYDGLEPGISMSDLRAWNVTVCPTLGQTFTGAGGWRACVFRQRPGPGQWVLAPYFYLDMTDNGYGDPVTSTLSNPCITFWDVELGVDDGDLVYVYPTTTLGVSGGTAVSVYLEGMLRERP